MPQTGLEISQRNKKRDLLPYLTVNVNRGGQDSTRTIRRDNAWFVNGGVLNNRMDEWAIWRRYVTLLTVQYLETIEQNGVIFEVINIYLYIFFLFIDGSQYY